MNPCLIENAFRKCMVFFGIFISQESKTPKALFSMGRAPTSTTVKYITLTIGNVMLIRLHDYDFQKLISLSVPLFP